MQGKPSSLQIWTRWYAAAASAFLLALPACGPLQVEMGMPFDARLLTTALHQGQSTTADVRAVLGTPFGTGSAMMPYHDHPRSTWTYLHSEMLLDSRTGNAREKFGYMFVFFSNDRFDGYIWFDAM